MLQAQKIRIPTYLNIYFFNFTFIIRNTYVEVREMSNDYRTDYLHVYYDICLRIKANLNFKYRNSLTATLARNFI